MSTLSLSQLLSDAKVVACLHCLSRPHLEGEMLHASVIAFLAQEKDATQEDTLLDLQFGSTLIK